MKINFLTTTFTALHTIGELINTYCKIRFIFHIIIVRRQNIRSEYFTAVVKKTYYYYIQNKTQKVNFVRIMRQAY